MQIYYLKNDNSFKNKHVRFRCLQSSLSFSSQGDRENVLTLWKMDPHQARMSFAQAVDNSLIPGKPVLCVQHMLFESFSNIIFSTL